MAFNPSSTIYLCNVPIDNTYKNQIYFSSKTEQQTYFSNRVQKTFSNYLTVRKTLPDGSMVSSVKVDCNIDDLYNCNYMYYQNANHGTRFFYAFITKLIYINEGTTEIRFETDVYQTWRFDVILKQSYVVREHSETDNRGGNIVPEKFSFQDYNFTEITPDVLTGGLLDKYGYLVGTSDFVKVEGSEAEFRGTPQNGIYQGMYFYYFPDFLGVSNFIVLAEGVSDCIQFICCIPEFCVSNASFVIPEIRAGLIGGSQYPASKNVMLNVTTEDFTFDGYVPKNKKMYTSPFFQLVVTNNAGDQVEYGLEDFLTPALPQFRMVGDVSVNPSVTLIPLHYKGATQNIDFGISIGGFPQCSFNSDTFKLWLAKNQYGLVLDTFSNLASTVAGVAVATATGGAGSALGVGQAVGGVSGILNTINSVYQASKEPNSTKSGSTKNNLLTAMKRNNYNFYIRTIKRQYAETIDGFFTMYGYQTNKVKIPNVSSRPFFNYIQTVDCNIIGGIPDDDMLQLKAMYNNGVTLWKTNATVGDYSVDNSPT